MQLLWGLHTKPVLAIGLPAGQIQSWRGSLPDALQAKASKHYISEFQRWGDELSALMSHGISVAAVSWIPGGPHGYFLSRWGMGVSCGLYFVLSLFTEPHSLPSFCVQHPGQTSCLQLVVGPFPKCHVWRANRLLIFVLGCIKLILKIKNKLTQRMNYKELCWWAFQCRWAVR